MCPGQAATVERSLVRSAVGGMRVSLKGSQFDDARNQEGGMIHSSRVHVHAVVCSLRVQSVCAVGTSCWPAARAGSSPLQQDRVPSHPLSTSSGAQHVNIARSTYNREPSRDTIHPTLGAGRSRLSELLSEKWSPINY